VRIAILVVCFLAACQECKGGDGDRCDEDDDCRGKLVCRAGQCVVGQAGYQDMAKQSGVTVVERPAAAASGPGSVHVRTALGEDVALAMCAANERLTGGWCDPPGSGGDSTSLVVSGATNYTPDDTIGAHWKCRWEGESVRAYAFCQVVSE